MFFKIIITAFFFCLFSSYANAKPPEEFKIDNGVVVYGYESTLDIPEKFKKKECDKYVFADKNFTPLKNGRYLAEGEYPIIVDNSCTLTKTGESELSDGRLVEFYQSNYFNINGNAVFTKEKDGYKRVYNKKLQLKNGKKFTVKDGYLSDVDDEKNHMFFGAFEGNDFVFEDRN